MILGCKQLGSCSSLSLCLGGSGASSAGTTGNLQDMQTQHPPLMHYSVIAVLAHSGSIYVMEITFIITDNKLWVSRTLSSQNPHPLISIPPPPS